MVQSKRNVMTRRAALVAGTVVIVGAGALAFNGRSARGFTLSAADGKTLHRGNGAEPDTLDPHKAQGQWEYNIIGDMFVGLFTEDAAANPVPGAALSYSTSDDGLIHTFKLRDHTWSDGVPVTANDFVYSFRRIADPKFAAQYVSILFPIRNMEAVSGGHLPIDQLGVRAIDDRTLEIAFRFQVPYVAQLLTCFAAFAVPRHVVEKHGDRWLRPENIVTNGPYTLKEWRPNDHVQLVRNPRFYDAANVKIESVFFYPTPDSESALKRMRGGELDLLSDSLPPQKIDWLKANMAKQLRLAPFINSRYVQFNTHRKPFDDARAHRAVARHRPRSHVRQGRARGRAARLCAHPARHAGLSGQGESRLSEPVDVRAAGEGQAIAC